MNKISGGDFGSGKCNGMAWVVSSLDGMSELGRSCCSVLHQNLQIAARSLKLDFLWSMSLSKSPQQESRALVRGQEAT